MTFARVSCVFVVLTATLSSALACWATNEVVTPQPPPETVTDCYNGYCQEKVPLQLDGSCPKITYIANPDVTVLDGKVLYRRLSSMDNDITGCQNDCVTMYVAKSTTADTPTVNLGSCCQKKQGTSYFAECGVGVGTGTFGIDPTNPSTLTYVSGSDVASELRFLDMDEAQTYWMVYSCVPTADGGKEEYFCFDTQSPTLTDDLKARLAQVLDNNGINSTVVVPTYNTNGCIQSPAF